MERLAYLAINFIKAYFVLYLAYKSIGIIFQPIYNIIAIINSIIKKKRFDNKKDFYKEARKDIYTLISILLYSFIYVFFVLVIGSGSDSAVYRVAGAIFAILFVMSFVIGAGVIFTPLPKKIRTKSYPVSIFANYLLPLLYWGSILFAIYVVGGYYLD